MLLSYKVRNFKSFFEAQTLSLDPVYGESEFDPLTVTAIYGANASGKSNLLDAISWATPDSVFRRRYDRSSPPLRTPFKLAPEGAVQTSEVTIELRLDGVEYSYGFEVDDEVFIREWLFSYPYKRPRMLFERTGGQVEIGSTIGGRKQIGAFASRVQPSRSILAVLSDLRVPEWDPVLSWFSKIEVVSINGSRGYAPPGYIARAIERQPILTELVRRADVGIRDIEIQERHSPPTKADLRRIEDLDLEIERLQSQLAAYVEEETLVQARIESLMSRREGLLRGRVQREPVFYHGDSSYPLQLQEQSQGTLEFLEFAHQAIHALERGGLVVIDEIESSLHSRLVPRIVELFRNRHSNPHGAQLIFTTHDTSLLGTSLGEPILRRDEVWFVEKNRHGESRVIPLSDLKPRKSGENHEKQYMGGAYGAVPAVFIDSLVEVVREHFKGEVEFAPQSQLSATSES